MMKLVLLSIILILIQKSSTERIVFDVQYSGTIISGVIERNSTVKDGGQSQRLSDGSSVVLPANYWTTRTVPFLYGFRFSSSLGEFCDSFFGQSLAKPINVSYGSPTSVAEATNNIRAYLQSSGLAPNSDVISVEYNIECWMVYLVRQSEFDDLFVTNSDGSKIVRSTVYYTEDSEMWRVLDRDNDYSDLCGFYCKEKLRPPGGALLATGRCFKTGNACKTWAEKDLEKAKATLKEFSESLVSGLRSEFEMKINLTLNQTSNLNSRLQPLEVLPTKVSKVLRFFPEQPRLIAKPFEENEEEDIIILNRDIWVQTEKGKQYYESGSKFSSKICQALCTGEGCYDVVTGCGLTPAFEKADLPKPTKAEEEDGKILTLARVSVIAIIALSLTLAIIMFGVGIFCFMYYKHARDSLG